MTDSDTTRRKRRAHALEAIGLRAYGVRTANEASSLATVRAVAAMLAEVEENLCRKIGAKR